MHERLPKTVACLAGDGVGPELMAAAPARSSGVRAARLRARRPASAVRAARRVTRFGHPLPAETRAGYRDVDAILVASPDEPALDGVKADLQLEWRVARVHVGADRDVVVIGPVGGWANERCRRARVRVRGRAPRLDRRRRRLAGLAASRRRRAPRAGTASRSSRRRSARCSSGFASAPETVDVVVAEAHFVDAVVDAAAPFAGSRASVARAWLAGRRARGSSRRGRVRRDDVAGFGVVDPTGMLLTASLMLAEGLERRAASRTLERAVGAASQRDGRARDTREFTDAVIELLPQPRTDVEHFDEVWRQ